MYGICTYIWLIFIVNVDKYTIHGSSGSLHMNPQKHTEVAYYSLLGPISFSLSKARPCARGAWLGSEFTLR